MRVIHTADWHLGKNLEGRSRLDEQELFLKDFVQIVEEQKADVVLIAGDIYDSVNPSARAEKLFYDTLKKISKNGECLTVVIAGNHDNPLRLVAASPLAAEHGIIMVGTSKTVIPVGAYGQHQVTESGEGYIEVLIGLEKAVILTVPFPSEKRLNEVLYGDMDTDEQRLSTYGERMKQLFDSLKIHFKEDTVNLIVSHLFVMDSVEGGSERSIQLGGSYIVSADIFPAEAQYVALGHIHKPQVVPKNHKVRYSGSPLHYHKGEEIYEKQVLCIDVQAGKEAVISAVPLKQYKPIEVWHCSSVTQAVELCEQNAGKNCWVYLEIETDRVILEDEIRQMKLYKEDILEIHPLFPALENQEVIANWKERPFHELFEEFYIHERGVPVAAETLQVLLKLVGKEEEDETC